MILLYVVWHHPALPSYGRLTRVRTLLKSRLTLIPLASDP